MAAITTAAAGNWSATGTWTGGVVPGNGDTVTLNHAVTVDVDTTVGTSPASGNVLRVNSGGPLTVAPGVTLTVRGDFWSYGVCTFQAGARLIFDSTQSAAPATTLYGCYILGGKVIFSGGESARCYVGNAVGSSKGKFTGNTGNGWFEADYCDFVDIAGSGYFIQSGKVLAGAKLALRDCTLTGCGKIDYSEVNAAGFIDFQRIDFGSSRTGSFLRLYCASPSISDCRIIKDCSFDTEMAVNLQTSIDGFEIDDNIFEGGLTTVGSGSAASFKRNLGVQKTGTANIAQFGNAVDVEDSYFYLKTANHALHVAHKESLTSVLNNVFELGVDSVGADAILYQGATDDVNATLSIRGNIVLPRPGNYTYGTLYNSAFIGKNLITEIIGNTACASVLAFERVSSTVDLGRSGAISSIDKNIFWNPSASSVKCDNYIGASNSGFGISSGSISSATSDSVVCSVAYANNVFNGHKIKILTGTGYGQVRDITANTAGTLTISPSFATIPDNTSTYVIYVPDAITVSRTNCGYNISSGTCYDINGENPYSTTGYDGYALTSAIGTTDITANPNFVDASVNIASWDASLGGPGTFDHALEEIKKKNSSGYNASYSVSNLLAYIRNGFTPQNTSLLTAGYDGGYIGAVQPINPDSTAPVLTSASATATSATTATGSVSTDDPNGTLYFLFSTNPTEEKATVKAALSQSVTAAGAQSISLSALDPETTYYVHFVQINGASLESASVVSTAAFTTDAIAVKGATITLHAGTTPQASITGIVALWWDTMTPSGAPDYSTTTASTDASGVLALDLDASTTLSIGDSGFLLLYKLNVTDHRDSLVFAGRVAVSDIA